jgi:hypothetical protein
MWSGVDRYDYYTYSTESTAIWGYKPDDIIQIPTNITDGNYNWQIINSHWNSNEVKMYYEYFHTSIFAMIMAIEHILRIQWYLEKLNIKYFMSTYVNIFADLDLINHSEIVYLYKQLDFSKFLPVNGCYEWLKDNYPIDGLPQVDPRIDNHPLPFGYKKFSDDVILPFLNKLNYI